MNKNKNLLIAMLEISVLPIYSMDTCKLPPLHFAAMHGHVNAAQALINSSADINAQAPNGLTPLHCAAGEGYRTIVEMLIEAKANVNAQNFPFEETPLHFAAKKGYTEIIKILIAAKADVNAIDSYDESPLHIAARNGHTEIVQALITRGADIHIKNKNKATPLHIAVQNNHTKTALTLIAAGADVNAKTNSYYMIPNLTPLHLAVEHNNIEIVQALITAHAPINAKNFFKNTPLHDTAKYGFIKIMRVLIAAGADTHAVNSDNVTPLQLAVQTDKKEISTYLSNLQELAAYLYTAVHRQDLTATKELLAQGAPIFTQEVSQDTPVHQSIRAYNPAEPTKYDIIAKELIRASGYEVAAARNQLGQTPLHIAAIHGNVWIAEYLLRHGAPVNAQDSAGNTPLHVASSYAMRNKLLLRHHADVSIINHNGETAISHNINLWMPLFTQQ